VLIDYYIWFWDSRKAGYQIIKGGQASNSWDNLLTYFWGVDDLQEAHNIKLGVCVGSCMGVPYLHPLKGFLFFLIPPIYIVS